MRVPERNCDNKMYAYSTYIDIPFMISLLYNSTTSLLVLITPIIQSPLLPLILEEPAKLDLEKWRGYVGNLHGFFNR